MGRRQAGYNTKKALIINFIASGTILIGALCGYFLLDKFEIIEAPLLGITAGSFLIVVFHDLIPHSISSIKNNSHIAKHIAWAVLGMVTGISWLWFLIPLSLLILLVLIRGKYSSISRFLFLVTPFLLLYVVTAFLVKPDWVEIVKGTFIPTFGISTAGYLAAAIAVLGTTVSAYLLFWETSQEIEQKKSIDHLEREAKSVTMGMIFCNLIFYFIIFK